MSRVFKLPVSNNTLGLIEWVVGYDFGGIRHERLCISVLSDRLRGVGGVTSSCHDVDCTECVFQMRHKLTVDDKVKFIYQSTKPSEEDIITLGLMFDGGDG